MKRPGKGPSRPADPLCQNTEYRQPRVSRTGPIDSDFVHQFWDDQGGDALGQEYDLVTRYVLNEWVSFLWKAAYFDGGKNRSPTGSITRSTLQTTLSF